MDINCPLCGKLYKTRHFIRHMVNEHGWIDEDAETYYIAPVADNIPDDTIMTTCKVCGAEIPNNLVICWSCGTCVNEHIKELAEAYRDE